MIYLSFLFLILAMNQHGILVECNYINVTFSATNITLNGSFEVTLLDFLPNPGSFPTITCNSIISGGASYELAKYNFPAKKFYISAPLPNVYKGRVNITSDHKIEISPVKFTDEGNSYKCTFTHYEGATPVLLSSNTAVIEHVYTLPVISANYMQEPVTVIEGTPKELTCSVTSRPASKITWSTDPGVTGNQTQSVQRSGDYFLTTGRFNIDPVYTMDGKRINCTGIPVFGSVVSKGTSLNVQYRPKNTAFSVTPAKLTLGSNVQLMCSATGKPNVTNYKFYINGRLVGNTTDGKVTLTASSCTNYTGTYTCVPESSIGEGERNTTMKEFNGTVTLTSMLSSKSIDEGQNETLSCSANGCPVPTIRWTKDGANLTQTGNALTLSSVNKTDTGKYACHANNGRDSKSAEMTLTVNYKPDMVTFTTPTLKPVDGNQVVFNCTSNGLPSPSYRIHRINGTDDTVVQDSSSSIYTILSINYADYIDYKVTFKCVPYNRLGNGPSKNHTLDIQVPPMTSLTMSPMTIREFGSATLRCVVSAANPPPSISLKDPSNGTIIHSNGVVAFTNVSRHGHGVYSCIANNSVGLPVTKTTVLMVQYQPDATMFSSSPSSKPIHGQSLTLNCSSNGRPAPSYAIESVTGSNSTTVLSNTTSGIHTISKINYADYVDYKVTFRCVPHNFIGSGPLKDISLEVQVRPILVISSNETVEEGGNVTLSCNITAANPPANITWKNPSDSIIAHTNGVITLNSIKRQQAGRYSCHANNGVVGGAVTNSAHVVVQHAPVESKLTASHAAVIENGTVRLNCTAVAVPAAKFEFYQMSNGNKDTLSASGSDVSGVIEITVLRNAKTKGYNNTYGCKAMNSLGNSTEQQVVVNVLVKPTGIALSPNVAVHRVNEGSKVDIECSISASNPSAQFKWTKSGSVSFSKTSVMLSFPTVNRTDAGNYTCNASNAHGNIAKQFELVVEYGPEITNGQSMKYQKCLTSSVNITCEAVGLPRPFVQIMFAGTSKKNGTGSAVYTINGIKAAEFGNYICVAKSRSKEVNSTTVLEKIAHPGAVTGVKLDKATETSLEISWGLPVLSCPGSIKEIKIEYKELPAGATKTIKVSGASVKAKIDGLTAEKEYEITVITVDRTNVEVRPSQPLTRRTSVKPTSAPKTGNNAALIGGIAGGIMFLIILIIIIVVMRGNRRRPSQVMPTEPLLFTLEAIGSDKILVKWSTSQPATSNPVNHYNIYWKALKGQENVKSVKGSADTYREQIDGLRPATRYEFRIVAIESDGTIGRCSLPTIQSTDHESGEIGHIGAYGTTGTVEKKSNDVPMKDMNNGNNVPHYFGPDGKSVYASVSLKDKNKNNAPGGVDNPKFVADSDGAYEPVVSITPKQSPAPKKKPEGNYAELSSFQVSGNAVTPESKPVKTEYATLEEVGPIVNKVAEAKPDGEEPETHKVVVSPEKEEDTADSNVTASKVDII